MTASDPAVDVQGLTKQFDELTAVRDLNLQVHAGEIFGLVGPDGAGKTTSLRMMAGIMEPSTGVARIAGCDVVTQTTRVKDAIAYMSQKFGLYVDLTVEENIDFYADLYGVPRKGRRKQIEKLLDFSAMGPFKKRRAGFLSGGMKQKLQLVCALIHTPTVLLLDEPTNGVDPVSRRDFWRILYGLLGEGVAIVVATAYLDEAERCNRVGLLNSGELLVQGPPSELKQLMPEQILTVQSSKPRMIYNLVREILPDQRNTLFGDRVHVATKEPKKVAQKINDLLNAKAVGEYSVKMEPPTIEDVFVGMMADTGAEDGGSSDEAGPARVNGAPSTGRPAVQVEKLTRSFGSFTAVDRISFTVPEGQIFGFLGPNGAGKSTCIRMLCGLLQPSSGGGSVAGYDIMTQAESIKQNIGYMSQKFSLYDDLTVEENIDFYGGIYGLTGSGLADRKSWAITMSGLNGRQRSMTSLLSGGWKQRLAMACAVLHEPPIVFLDEPTSGADPLSRRRFWDLIYDMADRGVTVFVTTHYMEEAEYCDRLVMIYSGKVIAMGTPRELKTAVMKDTVLHITCPHPQDRLGLVEQLPAVREAALFGAGIHAVVDDEHAAVSAIRNAFEKERRRLDGVEKIVPGMEDVFVSLVEAEQQNGEAV